MQDQIKQLRRENDELKVKVFDWLYCYVNALADRPFSIVGVQTNKRHKMLAYKQKKLCVRHAGVHYVDFMCAKFICLYTHNGKGSINCV